MLGFIFTFRLRFSCILAFAVVSDFKLRDLIAQSNLMTKSKQPTDLERRTRDGTSSDAEQPELGL